ncbi:pyrimidine-specific ribonucleoside hydrolase RihA [Andreesenia angusta]|uniref:Pyrimidine-specific ribonucleoside hydrolase RihA n=1 Tax=Andreesenia angusta TaxID=39480 RepID=A0A1S1V9F6_9FIRM|nr:nucleoside hydrolase [Andreesenia angusta]OHW62359.1 pyrimidine-specific ribonucleoside hydrolase RihA [Andreesenia angusta]
MKKVIFDCDNTMGVCEKDVDDGLALLYLLGRADVSLLGVTTTFGNSSIDVVQANTMAMFEELSLAQEIPLAKGAGAGEDRRSEASKFLLESAKRSPGEISLLATGSLTNLYGAYLLDNDFFSYLKEIVIMGGVKEPLIINQREMNELNFSVDAAAAYNVLKHGKNITVITGHICLQALFGKETYSKLMKSPSNPVFKYIQEKTLPWFNFIGPAFGVEGFYNWDVVAAVYLTNPEIFKDSFEYICSEPEELTRGYLNPCCSSDGYSLNIPTDIVEKERFDELVFSAWENAF